MSKSKYHHVEDGEWVPTKRRGNFEQCCDCGLVHVVDYRINKHNQIEFRAKRHGKATGGARKHFKFEKDEP